MINRRETQNGRDLMVVLDACYAVRDILHGTDVNKTWPEYWGLCAAVEDALDCPTIRMYDMRRMFSSVCALWPDGTGYASYPIPAPPESPFLLDGTIDAATQHYDTSRHWSGAGLEERKVLLSFVIDYIERLLS
jgi:hypothetical protein